MTNTGGRLWGRDRRAHNWEAGGLVRGGSHQGQSAEGERPAGVRGERLADATGCTRLRTCSVRAAEEGAWLDQEGRKGDYRGREQGRRQEGYEGVRQKV